MKKTICCFCDYTGTARGVKIHMSLAHPQIWSLRKLVRHGRPPSAACELCGLVHEEIPRPGWAVRRRKLERPKAAVLFGDFPPDHAGRSVVLGNTTVPEGVTTIKGLRLWAEQPGRITITVTDPETGNIRKEAFEVGPGYARKVATDTE